MSISNAQLIRDILSLANIYGPTEAIEPEDSEFCLRKVNALLSDWEADGINLQYFPHSMDELGQDCPIPDDAILAVTYYGAFAVAPHYGKQLAPQMLALGRSYYERLLRDAVTAKIPEVKEPLIPRGTGDRFLRATNILDG
jgi:hypothetical protein